MNICMNICFCFSRLRAACAPLLAAGAFAASGLPGPALADAPTAATVTTVYSFNAPGAQSPAGYAPYELVAAPGGGFYGLTGAGGANGAGAVVHFPDAATDPAALYAFSSSPSTNSGLLIGTGGTLYGTDSDGGVNTSGALYRLAPDGSQESTLYSFTAVDPVTQVNTDGSYPVGSLVQGSDGALYGETLLGGSLDAGVVYKVHADGSGFTVLHDFGSGSDGVNPVGGLITGPDGDLYGVTEYGGSGNDGTVFKVAPNGSGYTVLYQFSGADPTTGANTDGAAPVAALTLGSDDLLYGVASAGGPSDSGVIFQLGASGANFSVLYAFSATNGANANEDGATPSAALVTDAEGNFYGTTASGGVSGKGTLFLVTAGGVLFNPLASFGSSSGTSPALTMGSDGILYGLTADGGANNFGCVFQVDLHRPATHVLWVNTSGATAIWTYSPFSGFVSQNDYGPYSGWTATALADGPDGQTRVLWDNTNGTASLWSLNSSTGQFSQFSFGPYAGWTAKTLSVGADNTTHVLWTNTSGQASLWNYSTTSGTFTQNAYGPYPGWTAKSLADGPDALTHILWTRTNGSASIWSLDNLAGTFTQFTYGPYPGWTAAALTVNVDSTTHVLWANTSGKAALWNDSTGTGVFSENDYGPYPGWAAQTAADGSDALSRVLWTNTNGSASLWSLNTLTGQLTFNTYGPYAGWTAKALSAGQ